MVLSIGHHVQFLQLLQFPPLNDPLLQFLLPIDVDIEVVIEVPEDTCVDDCGDEECNCRRGVIVDFDVEGLGAGADQVAEVELYDGRSTRKSVEKAERPMQ